VARVSECWNSNADSGSLDHRLRRLRPEAANDAALGLSYSEIQELKESEYVRKRRRIPHLEKLVSGGQTGVDRAALDVALDVSIPCGGWCPRGRNAEDGVLDAIYPLIETPTRAYAQRTEWNVRDSDGTLILARGRLSGGTALTCAIARRLGKPCHIVDLSNSDDPSSTIEWLEAGRINVLNVAGPRESQNPGIYEQAVQFTRTLLDHLSTDDSSETA
jgi:hypothetical protein